MARSRYYKTFRLVELQSTFYRLPRQSTAERWRREAPGDFEFTVKAWQVITHPPSSPTWRRAGLKISPEQAERYGLLRPAREVFEAWEKTAEICRKLRSRICLIQCPPRFSPTTDNINNTRRFMKSIDRRGLLIAWEPRGDWISRPDLIRDLCSELQLIHVVDILRRLPAKLGPTVYVRLHGLGKREYNYSYRYSDGDLNNLRERINALEKSGVEEVYVLFNNMAMADDAKRFMDMMGV